MIFLHPRGDETPRGNPHFEKHFDDVTVAVPLASRSWFSARNGSEDFILKVRDTLPSPVAVCGISMGGQAALRLAFKYPELFPVAYSISGAIDYHDRFDEFEELPTIYRNREQCRQETATLWAGGRAAIGFCCDPADEWWPGNARFREKLRAIGVEHTADLATSHGGHCWDYFNAMAEPMMAFLKAGLDKERRRLL